MRLLETKYCVNVSITHVRKIHRHTYFQDTTMNMIFGVL